MFFCLKIVFLALFSLSAFSQIHFGTTHQYEDLKHFKKINDDYHNNILSRSPEVGFSICKSDHQKILTIALNNSRKNIHEVLIEMERLDGKVSLNQFLIRTILQYVVIKEMKKELASADLKEIAWSQNTSGKTRPQYAFNSKFTNLNFENYISDALDSAVSYKRSKELPAWFVESVKENIKQEMVESLIKKSYRVVISGKVIQFTSKLLVRETSKKLLQTAITNSSLHLAEVLVSVGKGFAIELLMMPLKGNRLPPSTLWFDLLNDYPAMILNPEIMPYAGIQDNPWQTHCSSINRNAARMEKSIDKYLKTTNEEFRGSLDILLRTGSFDKNDLREIYKVEADNTRVSKPKTFIVPRLR